MCEISLDYIDLDVYERRDDFANPQVHNTECNLHQVIFYPKNEFLRTTRTVSSVTDQSKSDIKTQKLVQAAIAPKNSVSAEVGVKWAWGDKEDSGLNGYASGSVSDDDGNSANVDVEVNSDGSGSVEASVKHEEK